MIDPTWLPESEQNPGQPTPIASFSVTELGYKADKVGKDDNFRGIGLFHNVLYYTKGSGGNGRVAHSSRLWLEWEGRFFVGKVMWCTRQDSNL